MNKSVDWLATFRQAVHSGKNYAADVIEIVSDQGKTAFEKTKKTAPGVTRGAIEAIKKGVTGYARSNPEEVKYMAGLGAAGLGGGIWIGGAIGVVGFFGGIGIPIAAIGAIAGAIIGNRLGVQLDKKKLAELNAEQSERLFQLLLERDQRKVERVKTNEEHRQKLFQGLAEAQECLVILSGWATSYVVDRDFQDRLAACL
jgi:outer membrane lipoprotein SlyB